MSTTHAALLTALRSYWERHPDVSLAQMLDDATDPYASPFDLPDDELLTYLTRQLEGTAPKPRHVRLHEAIAELQGMILASYPAATFRLERNVEDSRCVELVAIVDVEEMDAVLDLVLGRLVDFQTEGGLLLHVKPVRPRDG